MKKALIPICCVILFVMALAVASSAVMAADEKIVNVTMKDNGTTVAVHKGEFLEVTLPASAGTGYGWRIRSGAEGCLRSTGDPKRQKAEPVKKTVGAMEQDVFRFETPATGTTKLELEYARPWEKDKPAAKTFTVTVEVQ